MKGSYQLESFTKNKNAEVNRLKAQVDLFFKREFELYKKNGLKDGMNIIECGSGPGFLLMNILKEMPKCTATALEIDNFLVDILKSNSKLNNKQLFDVKHASIYDTKLPDNTFDFAISRLVIEHLQEPLKAIKELNRILKPGGKLVLVSNDFDYHLLTFPIIPELDEMYKAYCQSRFSENGNPLIGRQLPMLISKSGFSDVQIDIVCVHSSIEGDKAFLKAENVNISKSLVEEGSLKKESLDALAENWYKMLQDPDHIIYRQLFVISGEKNNEENVLIKQNQAAISETDKLTMNGLKNLDSLKQENLLNNYLINKIKVSMENDQLTFTSDMKLSDIDIDSLTATDISSLVKSDFNTELKISDILEIYSVDDISKIVIENISKNQIFNQEQTNIGDNKWTEGEL